MNDFRIFCELIAKTMLKAIDFTDVLEVYREMKSPRYWALKQIHVLLQYPHKDVEMKSPRYWALQPYIIAFIETIITVEMKSPRYWALQLFKSDLPAHFISRRK